MLTHLAHHCGNRSGDRIRSARHIHLRTRHHQSWCAELLSVSGVATLIVDRYPVFGGGAARAGSGAFCCPFLESSVPLTCIVRSFASSYRLVVHLSN